MSIDHDGIKSDLANLMDAFASIKETVRTANKDLFLRWQKGGFIIEAGLAKKGEIAIEAVIDELLDSEEDNGEYEDDDFDGEDDDDDDRNDDIDDNDDVEEDDEDRR